MAGVFALHNSRSLWSHHSTSPLFHAEKIKDIPAIVSRARTPGIILSSKDLIYGMMALIWLGYVVAAQIASSIRVLQNPPCLASGKLMWSVIGPDDSNGFRTLVD
jgi:hypothetical protein